MEQKEALKNCPFCGGKAKLDSRKVISSDNAEWWAICKSGTCNAVGPKCLGPESAIIIWNRRSESKLREAEKAVVDAAQSHIARQIKAGSLDEVLTPEEIVLYEALCALRRAEGA